MDIDFIKNIVNQFELNGQFSSCKPYGNGHINDTYLIEFDENGAQTIYILQRINDHVFKQPKHVVHNIEKVLDHLKGKGIEVLKTFSSAGNSYVIDAKKNHWRLYNFILNAESVEVVEELSQAYEAAKSYAEFQGLLLDVDLTEFYEIIPDFHNLEHRFNQFEKALFEDVSSRADSVKTEIDFVKARAYFSTKVKELLDNKEIPLRITHNDTKLNNVLLDEKTGKGLCVIDLDTVMPGTVLYDFGDMIRTFTSPVAEDEKDTKKVILRVEIFEEICRGYLSVLTIDLTQFEKDNLVLGAKYMILMIGLRFLTDYLQGDTYYKTKYEDHNLVRARNQFALLRDLENKETELELIVKKYC